MSFGPLKRKRVQRRIIAYDGEWYRRTYKLRVMGAYDPVLGYRAYQTMEEFIKGELSSRNSGAWFYAHAGGKYDVQFLLSLLRHNPDYEVQGFISNASVIILKVTDGHNKWSFIDSAFLLQTSIKKIGEALGYPKGDCDTETAGIAELLKYNRRDCEILYDAIDRFQEWVWENGGQLQATLASTGMQLVRRRFLKRRISTSTVINEKARRAYYASRVEIFRPIMGSGQYWDINSSFPKSMTMPLPASVKKVSSSWNPQELAIVDVTVKVPDSYVPPLPYRYQGRIFHPTGTWRGSYTGADLLELEKLGGQILSVHEACHFDAFSDLSEYVKWVYPLKQHAADPYHRLIYKFMQNTVYGKFGERGDRFGFVMYPENPHEYKMITPGLYLAEKTDNVPHAHVPISAYITAYSRIALSRFLRAPDTIFYCDTDSIVCGNEHPFSESDKLGELAREYGESIKNGLFLMPKLYNFESSDGSPITRAKGFRFSANDDESSFADLAKGDSVPVERIESVREKLHYEAKAGTSISWHPTDIFHRKEVRDQLPKRSPDRANNTRAWHVTELEAGDAKAFIRKRSRQYQKGRKGWRRAAKSGRLKD